MNLHSRGVAAFIVALFATTWPSAVHLPAGAATVVTASSIPADCSVDVTQAINAFLASVPDGQAGDPNVASFPPGGCYRMDGTVMLESRQHLVVDGNGSTFRATTKGALDRSGKSSRRHWVVVKSQDVTLQELNIAGTDTVPDLSRFPDFATYDTHYAEENGISVVQSDGITLTDDTINAVWGNGVELDASTAVVARGITVDKNGNNAIKVRDSRGVLFDQIAALHSRRAGFKLEPETGRTIDGVEIRSSTICSHGPAFFSSGVLGIASNVSIHDNRIDCAGIVAEVTRAGNPGDRRNWSITGNTVISTRLKSGAALLASGVQDFRVNDNKMTLRGTATPVVFRDAHGTLEVQRNDLRRAQLVYTIDGVVHGPGVDAWGNITALGPDQP